MHFCLYIVWVAAVVRPARALPMREDIAVLVRGSMGGRPFKVERGNDGHCQEGINVKRSGFSQSRRWRGWVSGIEATLGNIYK
ncbi:hypothetical protein LMH87_007063 [Akanthomyces muscarius]|uniref:Secreted protein n=1 Tax=Akanthomyces muscarius TaxID=2231603 RepID=A0A9W8UTT0_AKAMU|nr:hypothetical protein LMH87_007063 [Akanthomyces muscarius]KAJ4165429.1 hypothetical protein LMH87_007063 [Akanthomyces muscarius]